MVSRTPIPCHAKADKTTCTVNVLNILTVNLNLEKENIKNSVHS